MCVAHMPILNNGIIRATVSLQKCFGLTSFLLRGFNFRIGHHDLSLSLVRINGPDSPVALRLPVLKLRPEVYTVKFYALFGEQLTRNYVVLHWL